MSADGEETVSKKRTGQLPGMTVFSYLLVGQTSEQIAYCAKKPTLTKSSNTTHLFCHFSNFSVAYNLKYPLTL